MELAFAEAGLVCRSKTVIKTAMESSLQQPDHRQREELHVDRKGEGPSTNRLELRASTYRMTCTSSAVSTHVHGMQTTDLSQLKYGLRYKMASIQLSYTLAIPTKTNLLEPFVHLLISFYLVLNKSC